MNEMSQVCDADTSTPICIPLHLRPAGTESATIILADDHDLVRAGIKALLGTMPGISVVAEAGNGEELLAILELVRPDMVVTDISMPGLDGLAALRRIRERQPDLRVLVLSMFETAEFMKRAVASGANGYLLKGCSVQELEQAVRSIRANGSYFSRSVAEQLLKPDEPTLSDQLTGRQIEILTLLARGLSAREIGVQVGLSPSTITAHRAHIMASIGLNDLASLTLFALRNGLVDP
jgi:DNA-binding NarL/FixJ family response regulator